MQCLETAYEISLSNPPQTLADEPAIDLLSLVSTSTMANTTTLSSWSHTTAQPVNKILISQIKFFVS